MKNTMSTRNSATRRLQCKNEKLQLYIFKYEGFLTNTHAEQLAVGANNYTR
jgi:hypothetical protein